MEFISHRVNTIEELKIIPHHYGVEVDLRDDTNGKIYLSHEPFIIGEDFEQYLKEYHHGTIILNIKSERIEPKVLELMNKYNIKNYFFLDSSFPMIKTLSDKGIKQIAIRYSELEGIDTIRNMAGKVEWIWIDCFTKFPLDKLTYCKMKEWGYKLCMVSPELQGWNNKIEEYAQIISKENIEFDAICTKEYNIKRWTENIEGEK